MHVAEKDSKYRDVAPLLAVPKFKKGLGTSVHIVKITSYQKK